MFSKNAAKSWRFFPGFWDIFRFNFCAILVDFRWFFWLSPALRILVVFFAKIIDFRWICLFGTDLPVFGRFCRFFRENHRFSMDLSVFGPICRFWVILSVFGSFLVVFGGVRSVCCCSRWLGGLVQNFLSARLGTRFPTGEPIGGAIETRRREICATMGKHRVTMCYTNLCRVFGTYFYFGSQALRFFQDINQNID